MKILHVVRQFYPSVGGIENAVLALCRRLRDRGHRCDVVTLRRLWGEPRPLPPAEIVADLRVTRIPFVGGRRIFLAPAVLGLLSEYALVHVHAVDFFIDFLAATRWRHHKPLVVSTHGGFFHTPWAQAVKRIYFHTVTRLTLAQAARVICVSAQDDRLFAPIVPAHRRIVIGNGVEDAFLSVRKAIEPGLLVTVGRIAEHKRIDRLIDLLPSIARDIPGVRLIIVGRDWEGLQASLAARAAGRGVSERVVFAGEVDGDTLRGYLGRAHIVLAPSEYEGFGISVLEAMASGTIVAANDLSVFREWIVPDVNGFLVRFDDEPAAAREVVRVLRLSPSAAAEIGERARATASQCTWDRVADRVERVYEESLGRGPGR